MKYNTRKWVKPEDLNPNNSLFGGRLLEWIDEEAALYAIMQLENPRVVTKSMSEFCQERGYCRDWDRSSKIWKYLFGIEM